MLSASVFCKKLPSWIVTLAISLAKVQTWLLTWMVTVPDMMGRHARQICCMANNKMVETCWDVCDVDNSTAYPIGSVCMPYMVCHLPSIYPSHVGIYIPYIRIRHGYYDDIIHSHPWLGIPAGCNEFLFFHGVKPQVADLIVLQRHRCRVKMGRSMADYIHRL